jgi:vitamin B12 transporter
MKTHCPLALMLTLALTFPAAAIAQTARPVELDTLRVVVASRATTLATATRSVEVIDAAAIRRAPARTVAEVLAWALGTDVLGRSPAQADIALRGSTFEQVLVLVDGVRMNDAQTGHFHLNLAIPLEEIERIEVLRGPGSSIYGSDAMGGVIQIVTRGGGGGVEVGLEAGSFGMVGARAAVGGSLGPVRSRVAAEAQRSDGHRPGTDASSLLVRGSLEGALAGGPLRADLGLALRDFGARHFYTSPQAPFDEYERTRAATASLGWQAQVAAGWSLAPRLSARRHSDEFLLQRHDPDFYRNLHTSWQLGGELVAKGAPAAGVAVSLGGEAYRDRLESTNLGDPSETRAALFGELAAGREGVAVAHAGVRGDHHSAYGAFVAPSLAVAAWPAPAVKLRASAGRSFRAPNWTERYYVDPANEGDPGLRPETAWNGEVGAEVAAPGGAASVGLAAFVRDARQLIDWARPAADPDHVWRAMNVGRAVFRGLELDARATGPAGTRWTAQAAVLGFTTHDHEWESKYALRPLTRTASLAAERSLLGADASVRGRLARRATETDHFTVDARLSRAVSDRLRLDLDLTNLTDTRYLDVTGLPAPGRAAYVRVAWR